MPRICRVLIVEGYAGVRELLGDLVNFVGYDFRLAASAQEMREALRTSKIDVAVIDLHIPGSGDGLALAKEVADSGVGVILVTGYPDHFERVEKSGHNYLLKPFRAPSFFEMVQRTLKETKARCKARGKVAVEPSPAAP
jgi:two-component system OmpR family response regulator